MLKMICADEGKNAMNTMMMNGFDVHHPLSAMGVKRFECARGKEEVHFEAGLELLHMELQRLMDKLANALVELPVADAKTEQDKKNIKQLADKVRFLSQLYLDL